MTGETMSLLYLRILEPHPGVLAFYDGRVEGHRFASGDNWVDDGALSLGTASYAIIQGAEALVYDTHVSVDHGRFIRAALEQRGVGKITVVLSHWHLDHVAGNEAFADCGIIANARTAAHLAQNKQGIEDGSFHGPPAIRPLVLPTRQFEGQMKLHLGELEVHLMHVNIHSDDATVLWIPASGVMLAGDTLEDTVTYVDSPREFDSHLKDLERLYAMNPPFILPNHGDPDIIAAGGYDRGLIRAHQQYLRVLRRCVAEPELRDASLADLIAGPLRMGWVHLFAPYEAVHRQNVARVVAALGN